MDWTTVLMSLCIVAILVVLTNVVLRVREHMVRQSDSKEVLRSLTKAILKTLNSA